MRDLVSIMGNEGAMIRLGFEMKSEDGPKEKSEKYCVEGISQYTRIVAGDAIRKYFTQNEGRKTN